MNEGSFCMRLRRRAASCVCRLCVSAVRQPAHIADLLLPAAPPSLLQPGCHGWAAALRHQQLSLHWHGQLHAVAQRRQRRWIRHGLLMRRFRAALPGTDGTLYVHFMSRTSLHFSVVLQFLPPWKSTWGVFSLFLLPYSTSHFWVSAWRSAYLFADVYSRWSYGVTERRTLCNALLGFVSILSIFILFIAAGEFPKQQH